MISPLDILREVSLDPQAEIQVPVRKFVSRSFCKRHKNRLKNPKSKSYCDQCLDYFRSRRPNLGKRTGRPLIPRTNSKKERA